MEERNVEAGQFVFELFEDSPRVLKVLEVNDNVVTVETEEGFLVAHINNFRLATAEEMKSEKGVNQ